MFCFIAEETEQVAIKKIISCMQRGSSSSSSSSYNKAKQKEKYSNSVVTKVRCKTHVFRGCWKKISILNFLFFGVKFNKLLSSMCFLSKILENGFPVLAFIH
jgi:hypothetical protein